MWNGSGLGAEFEQNTEHRIKQHFMVGVSGRWGGLSQWSLCTE
jgi:hypothetical protein